MRVYLGGALRSFVGSAVLALFLSGGTAAQLGCSPCSVRGQTAVDYTGGKTNKSGTIYRSADVHDDMLHFPQGRTYNLYHGLGSEPVSVELYLSFKKNLDEEVGADEDENRPNNLSPSAGNQAVIEAWNDEFVRVRNDTCAEFYLRVVATADPDDQVDSESGLGGETASERQ